MHLHAFMRIIVIHRKAENRNHEKEKGFHGFDRNHLLIFGHATKTIFQFLCMLLLPVEKTLSTILQGIFCNYVTIKRLTDYFFRKTKIST